MKEKNEKGKKGISLIVLVITIIVIVVLATAVILSIANNNPIENAKEAKFKSDIKTIEEELELLKVSNYAKNKGTSYGNEDGSSISMDDIISAAQYKDKFTISSGKLEYIQNNLSDDEKKWANEVNINSSDVYLLQDGKDGVTIENGALSTDWNTNGMPENVGTKIKIPEGVTEIKAVAFRDCTKLESVELPKSVIYIKRGAFSGCKSLISIDLSEVKLIDESAFSSTSLTSVNLKNVSYIGVSAFQSTPLTSIEVLQGQICSSAFTNCTSLTSIIISSEVIYIESGAFFNCTSLTSVIIGKDSEFEVSDAGSWGIDTTKCTVIKQN